MTAPAPDAFSDSWPTVSVVVPARDEADHLPQAVGSALGQDYFGDLEVVVAVAPSSDRTEEVARELAARDARVRVGANPDGGTSAGLNAAVAAARGEVVVRLDGHAELPEGYVTRAVTLLRETGADNVGGVQRAEGESAFERAVAVAMTSRFGTGDARFHYGGPPGAVDTVYLGVFRREALERVGGFDESLARNQDYELNYRLRRSGGTVYFHPDLEVRYRPRSSLGALARQYFEYGRWKRVVLRRHPGSVRWRQLVPPLTVVANVLALVAAATVDVAFLLVPGLYLNAVAITTFLVGARHGSAVTLWLPAVFATMHHAWGLGFLMPFAARRSDEQVRSAA